MQLAIQTMGAYGDTLELARWAEAEELAAFSVADHYLSRSDDPYALDQLSVIAAVAAQTERIQLATLVSPITFRHPATMLKSAVTIDEISGGRFTLGVGAGWMEPEHTRFGLDFPPTAERFARLEDALGYLRAAIDGNELGYEGAFYRLAPGVPPEPRGSNLRLVVGGSGARRTPALAGTFADEFNLSAAEEPVSARVTRAREAAAAAGRDPGALLTSIAFPLVVGSDPTDLEDQIEAVAAWRGSDPEAIRTKWKSVGIPVATAPEYRERLAELEAAGVQRVYFQVAYWPTDAVRRAVALLRS